MIQLVGTWQEPKKKLSMFLRVYSEVEFFCCISLLGMYLKKAMNSENNRFNFQEYRHAEEVNAHVMCLTLDTILYM